MKFKGCLLYSVHISHQVGQVQLLSHGAKGARIINNAKNTTIEITLIGNSIQKATTPIITFMMP
jgi:hypothetical protein